MAVAFPRRFVLVLALIFSFVAAPSAGRCAEPAAKVYVVLWFDTEDYLLPASDDAALKVADFLTREGIRATFKVVGEKARTLERRQRTDVIAALKKHEIGFHSNYHSVQPTPALYLSDLGWDDGVAEFDRREGPGRADVERVFGVAPTCYGQPGSSWGPQSYGAMRKWGMPVYLDAGDHVNLDGKPCYYGGILNLYKLTYTLRADLRNPAALEKSREEFAAARKKLLTEGGGLVSIFYHPCEFVHKEFWDGVNFRKGANPPRSEWKAPPAKTAEETKIAYEIFENYLGFIKRFPEVQFITASEAAKLYRDRARGRFFTPTEIAKIAAGVGDEVSFQKQGDFALSASEIFALLNEYLAVRAAGRQPERLPCPSTPDGPANAVPVLAEPVTTDWSQLTRTSQDVADFLRKQKRVPTSVWLGSNRVPPEAYLRTVAKVVADLIEGKEPPKTVAIQPARFTAARFVSDDDPRLWSWTILPPGTRAPLMMDLAKRQAWTLKPALLQGE